MHLQLHFAKDSNISVIKTKISNIILNFLLHLILIIIFVAD